jgi:hypothetical protein
MVYEALTGLARSPPLHRAEESVLACAGTADGANSSGTAAAVGSVSRASGQPVIPPAKRP